MTDSSRFIKYASNRYPDLATFRAATGQEQSGKVSTTCP